MTKYILTYLTLCLFTGLLLACDSGRDTVVTWEVNSLKEIHGNPITVWGNPEVIETNEEEAVEFDGVDDGLLLHQNPIAGMHEFTIEVDIKPYPGFPDNLEQRFLHIQDPKQEDRRILLELRLNDRDEWYGDWFIRNEKESLTLVDSSFTHPVGEWATMSLEYKNGTVKGYVNGNQEVSGEIDYLPIGPEGKTSIGTRMDKRSWFKGAIKEVRFEKLGHIKIKI